MIEVIFEVLLIAGLFALAMLIAWAVSGGNSTSGSQ